MWESEEDIIKEYRWILWKALSPGDMQKKGTQLAFESEKWPFLNATSFEPWQVEWIKKEAGVVWQKLRTSAWSWETARNTMEIEDGWSDQSLGRQGTLH